jgi:hypothetical protein
LTGIRPNQINPQALHSVDPTIGPETGKHHGHEWWI